MQPTCLFAAVAALFAISARSEPVTKYIPLGIVPRPMTTTVFFKAGTPPRTVELTARAAAEEGSKIIGYFNVPPTGHHDLGFAAHLSIDGKNAVLNTAYFEKVTGIAMEEQGRFELFDDYCPEALCRS